MRSLAVGAATVLAVLLIAAILAAPDAARAQGQGSVAFTRPVPVRPGPGGNFQACTVGHFAELPVQNWKLMFRGDGAANVGLTIAALGGADEAEGPGFRITVQDDRGLQSKTVNKAGNPGPTESVPVTLSGGRVYDLNVERLGSRTLPGGYHYRLGATDPRLEIGWRDPLPYHEADTEWAFHTEAGERFELEVLVEPNGGTPQATRATVEVFRPDGTPVLSATAFPTLPAKAIGPASSGETLIVRIAADGHFLLRKATGSDIGFYAVPCQSPAGQPATGANGPPVPAARVADRPPASAPDSSGANRTPVVIGALVATLVLVGVASGIWQLATRRPLPKLRWRQAEEAAPSAEDGAGQLEAVGSQDALQPLTTREREVVALLARGLTNRQIAERLVISQGTAKRHVENILEKLELKNRSQVAAWAVRYGLWPAGHDAATGHDISRPQPPER